ncbi:MAG: hypothetical protein ACRDI2_03230 [Chloroflexota bacterium]
MQTAEAKGWTVSISQGHAWGIMRCPYGARGGYQMSIWSTPRDAGNHAKQLLRALTKCPH